MNTDSPNSINSVDPKFHFKIWEKILAGVILVLALAYFAFAQYLNFWPFNTMMDDQVLCTQEAMQCPDGSYVGRTGPKCEFAKCSESTLGEKIFTSNILGFKIDVPDDWHTDDAGESVSFSPSIKGDEARGIHIYKCVGPQDEFEKQVRDGIRDSLRGSMRKQQVNLSGVTSIKISYEVATGGRVEHIFIPKNGNICVFADEDYDQILSTFRFIEKDVEDQFCGGIAAIQCPEGYTCKLDGYYPDAGGKCTKEESVFCTQDAKQCLDGSWVGRTGPNCEFVCP